MVCAGTAVGCDVEGLLAAGDTLCLSYVSFPIIFLITI